MATRKPAIGGTDAGTIGGTGFQSAGVDSGNVGDLGGDAIDPVEIEQAAGGPGSGDAITGLNKDGSVRKKRGRKAGTAQTAKGGSLDLNGLEALLLSGHAMLAAMVKVPELAIAPTEAEQLARAAANVARHYDLGASQKTLDWISLGTVMASIYGPRAIAVWFAGKKSSHGPQLAVDNA